MMNLTKQIRMILQCPVTEMSTAFLCPQDNLLSFNDPPLFSLHPRDHLSTTKEALFGVLWDLSLLSPERC